MIMVLFWFILDSALTMTFEVLRKTGKANSNVSPINNRCRNKSCVRNMEIRPNMITS